MIKGTLTVSMIGHAFKQEDIPADAAHGIIDQLKQGVHVTVRYTAGEYPRSMTIMAHNVQSISWEPAEGNQP